MIGDTLRPPPLFDPTAPAYKDWLHLNVFHEASGSIGIFNASLHGAPHDPRSRAIGTALVHSPDAGWVGNVEVAAIADASVGATSIGLERIALGTDATHGTVLVSARLLSDGLEAGITARARSRPVDIEHPLPFGSGWIAWYIVPRLAVTGGLSVEGRRFDVSDAVAYHDHNWGRWHWGDDLGWEWGAASAADLTVVVSRATDRSHRASTGALLVVDAAGERRTFSTGVGLALEGRLETELRRLPGALAALHQDRIAPALPGRIIVRANDGVDSVELEFRARAAAQLIAGDPAKRGYGLLHQLIGTFAATCRIAGRAVEATGLAVFEYVI